VVEQKKRTSKGDGSKVTRKRQARTLGPVSNLEEHVASDWWSRIFNSMYLKTDGDVVEDSRITSDEVTLLNEILDLGADDRVLDLCCGQGRHTLELARRGFHNVEGIDRSHYLIGKAKQRAKSENLDVKFRVGDARKLPFQSDRFATVLIMGNSFGYFDTPQDDLKVLREVFRVLMPWGRILVDIADGEYLRNNFQARSWEWINSKLFVCRERSLSADGNRLVSREVVTDVEKGIVADQFYAERLYSRETLNDVLTEAGFTNVEFKGDFSPDSQRNQDLGMMERRIIATAQVRKQWTPVRSSAKKQTLTHVAVVTGDPSKEDPLKPLRVFDTDDFYTIDQMKFALRDLNGYQFTYLSNHDTLIRDLTLLKGKVDYVLNLCDEGYNNDPRHELHVPVILEMLGIPYSGGGPQCLAYCYDKSLVRGIAKEMGIPVPSAIFVRPEDSTFEIPFDFPVIVKPNMGDSSIGITAKSVAYTADQLIDAISDVRHVIGDERPILVEEFLTGKDLTLGMIGNPKGNLIVLPIAEEDYSSLPIDLPKICGYEAKWDPTSPYWQLQSIRAELPEATENDLVSWSTELFERLECRDYVRFDWRLDAKGLPRLLEANPNPGWCWDGHLAKMSNNSGMNYSQMLGAILKTAEERLGIERRNSEVGESSNDAGLLIPGRELVNAGIHD